MKHIFTFALMVALALSISAQPSTILNKRKLIGKPSTHLKKEVSRSTTILSEDFESGAMPTGWTEDIGNSTQGWVFSEDESSDFWEIPPHTIYACINDDKYNCDMSNIWLISPVIDLSSAIGAVLNFEYIAPTWTDDICAVKVSIDGGTTWSTVASMPQTDEWEHMELNLSNYAGESNFKLAFYYSDNDDHADDYGLALDDVLLYEPSAHDLAVTAITPNFVFAGDAATPAVTITSFSGVTETIEEVSLSDGSYYNETLTVNTTINALGETVIEFPAWTPPAAGTYNLMATVSITGDENPDNNTFTSNCIVMEELVYPAEAYVVNGHTEQYGSFDITTGEFTPIGSVSIDPAFPMAEEYNGKAIYRVYHDATMGIVLPETGQCMNLKPIVGIGSNAEPTGMAWDWENNKMYMTCVDNLGTAHFGTIDLSTYTFSEISTRSSCKIIAIDMANDGFIYGPTLDSDKLYKIDPVTGAFSVVGSVGVNLNYGQDVSFDLKTNIFYTIAVNQSGNIVFGNYNLNTGHLQQTMDIDNHMITFAITKKGGPDAIAKLNTINMSVSPNPNKGVFKVEAQGVFDIEIVDITGKTVYTGIIQDIANINIANVKAGVYILRLRNAEGVGLYKIVKE